MALPAAARLTSLSAATRPAVASGETARRAPLASLPTRVKLGRRLSRALAAGLPRG